MAKEFGRVQAINENQRTMSNWDMFATWIGANANNGTWYIGGVIAAAGMYTASTTLIVTGIMSYLFLTLASYMGYIVQFIGWAAANTFIAAISISVIFKDLLGWTAYANGGKAGLVVGIIIMSLLHLASISLGEKSVRLIERIGIILVIIFVVWEAVVVFQNVSLNQISAWQPPKSVRISSGTAIDILAAFNLAWVTASSDFSRFAKKNSGATGWSFLGANIGLFGFAFIGLLATIGTAVMNQSFDPNDSDPSTIASKLGLGIIALLVIIITSTTANAVNLMAAGSALTNMWHKLKLTPALWIVTLIATAVSFIPLLFTTFLDAFTAFLD